MKRCQRLDGDDHFKNPHRPQMSATEVIEEKPPSSTLRADDIDVYLRLITYEEKITRLADVFVNKVKWVPLTKRYDIYKQSIEYS